MRYFLYCLIILLTSCTANETNYYTSTTKTWQGGRPHAHINKWHRTAARPVLAQNRDTYTVYEVERYRTAPPVTSPQVGVNVSGGRPVITTSPPTNPGWSTGDVQNCVVAYEIDRRTGRVVSSHTEGPCNRAGAYRVR